MVTCGAIIFYTHSNGNIVSEAFGFVVNDQLVDRWLSSGKRQLVTEAELYAALTALAHWQAVLSNSRVLFFIDSEPAMHCLLRGTSQVDPCAELVAQFHFWLASITTFVWFVRIPAKSNSA